VRTLLSLIAAATLAVVPLAAAADPAVARSSKVAGAEPAAAEPAPAEPAVTTRPIRGAREQAPPAGLRTRERGSTASTTTMVGLIALIAVGALAWWKRRKQPATEIGATIELLAQSSLGGRARAMWLRAGERDMVVAVTAQAVQVLAAWPNDSRNANASDADDDTTDTETAPFLRSSPSNASPCIDAGSRFSSFAEPASSVGSRHPRRPAARSALRAARITGSRCRPSHRRRGEEDPP